MRYGCEEIKWEWEMIYSAKNSLVSHIEFRSDLLNLIY